jgi:hypothetical protein
VRFFGLFLVSVVASIPTLLRADISTTIDFETFPDSTPILDSTPITTQFPGITFTNATVISAGISLNEFETPPHSGTNVAFDDGGPISILFATPITSFSGFFTYYEPLAINSFDASNNQVADATSAYSINVGCDPGPICLGDPGSAPNEYLQVSAPGGMVSVTITGDPLGSSFVMDDITYTTPTSVPEPAAIGFMAGGMLALIGFRRIFH